VFPAQLNCCLAFVPGYVGYASLASFSQIFTSLFVSSLFSQKYAQLFPFLAEKAALFLVLPQIKWVGTKSAYAKNVQIELAKGQKDHDPQIPERLESIRALSDRPELGM